MTIKICTITDSPKITTGFGNVARMILDGFHKSGMSVFSFGTMDNEMDFKGILPYPFQATSGFDQMGNREAAMFLVNVQPDVIFILFDPGSIMHYLNLVYAMMESGNLRKVPVVAYMPIEGLPIPSSTATLIQKLNDENGRAILYSPGMVELLNKQYPELKVDWVYHGLDHADFRKIPESTRNEYRTKAGWADYFVCGSVGVNKRTKGFDYIIYTARTLKDMGKEEGIKFYLHTNPTISTLQGYDLVDMAKKYHVEDMLIFKPESDSAPGGNVKGTNRYTNIRELVKAEGEENFLSKIGYIDRINMLDCYVDLSQVEGWGLPAHEAMRCGVPTISINDSAIREEIYKSGAIMIDPLPFRLWSTWHTNVKLALIDPVDSAKAIIELKESSDTIKKFWSDAAIDNAKKFVWRDSQEKFISIVKDVYNGYSYED